MKDLIINSVMKKIEDTNSYNKIKLLEIRYGLESLYLSITKILVIFVICIIMNTIKELILFLLGFSLLRATGFGLHTKKSWQCWATSIPIFTIIPYLIKNFILPIKLLYVTSPILLFLIILYSPADTEKRPLINKKKRNIYKIISFITAFVYILLIFFLNNSYITSVLFYSLLLDVMVINPVSYKLFGLKYKNYLNYERRR